MARMLRMVAFGLCVALAGSLAFAADAARPAPKKDRPRRAPAATAAAREKARENRVDQRQTNQQKRIEHGIRKGYLTGDELAKLDSEQKTIGDMETNFKADGRLNRDEMKQLRTALNDASVHIWAEKHDSEGNQMPTYRLGKNIFARPELTDLLQQDDLSGTQARQLVHDFHRTIVLKRTLAAADLTPDQRARLQAEFNDLLNKYFEIR